MGELGTLGLLEASEALQLKLSPAAWEQYREALREQVIGPEGLGVEELASLGMVVPDPLRPGMYVPAEPERVAEALRGSAVQTLTTVTGFLAQLPGFMEVMTDEFRRAQRTETAVVEIINKYEDINGRLSRAALSAQEVITCHPGRRQRELLELVEERDDKLLSRGAKLRTLYPATNRHDDWNRKWVSFVTERGAQVRTYPGPFPKMVVFDNREALIGIYADGELGAGALHIRHKEIVGFLRAVFELFWERADPWLPGSDARAETAEDQEDGAAGPYTTPETRSILWGLAQGKSQKLVAKEHGMSERTLISRLNKLKERLNIQTLPALMYWYGTSPERLIQD